MTLNRFEHEAEIRELLAEERAETLARCSAAICSYCADCADRKDWYPAEKNGIGSWTHRAMLGGCQMCAAGAIHSLTPSRPATIAATENKANIVGNP